ncbi:hypothetical protein IW147_002861 [Coemansia sp. RSA 720]|nr:hypothetical protein IW147_002861 [Coemansia sp. RSA 720]
MAIIGRRAWRLCGMAAVITMLVLWRTRSYEPPARAVSTAPTTRYTEPLAALTATPRVPSACFLFITRTMSLTKVRRTMFDIEQRFNSRYHYPYVFLSERQFSDEFQLNVRNIASSPVTFALINNWSAPRNDNSTHAGSNSKALGFRNMVRYWAHPFATHPALATYTRVWRLEPGAHFPCDFTADPFRRMHKHKLQYAFAISLASPAPTVWPHALDFLRHSSHLLHASNSMAWLFPSTSNSTVCQFLTNSELVDLRFIRSPAYTALFELIDRKLPFHHSQWSNDDDVTVRSLAVALLLDASQVAWLNDSAYTHDLLSNCPADPELQKRCHCDPSESSHLLPMSCSARWTTAPRSLHIDPLDLL